MGSRILQPRCLQSSSTTGVRHHLPRHSASHHHCPPKAQKGSKADNRKPKTKSWETFVHVQVGSIIDSPSKWGYGDNAVNQSFDVCVMAEILGHRVVMVMDRIWTHHNNPRKSVPITPLKPFPECGNNRPTKAHTPKKISQF